MDKFENVFLGWLMNGGGDLDCMIDNMPLGYALDTGPGAKQHTLLDFYVFSFFKAN